MIDANDVPGYRESVAAVTGITESTMPPEDVDRLVAVVISVSRPYVQAELFADLADRLTEDGFEQVGLIMDHTSCNLRRYLDGQATA